jgi:catechol 2,3-dioxygenase-like lactoylglutathione lyase family enzyme
MADTDDAIRFKAVNHITYNVTDLNRALRFWVDVLGVKQIPKQVDSDRLLWLQVPSGTMVHIILNDDAPSAPSHHSAFEVDDIEATERAMKAKGLETTAINTRNDGQRSFNINDPDGNRIEICTVSGFAAVT